MRKSQGNRERTAESRGLLQQKAELYGRNQRKSAGT